MAQITVKGMVSEVYHAEPKEDGKARDESTYLTVADGETGGMLKMRFPGRVEFKLGEMISGMATVQGRLFGQNLSLTVVNHTFGGNGKTPATK